MITVVVEMKLKAGKEEEAAEVMRKLALEVRANEEGVVMYTPHVALDDPGQIIWVEKYATQQAMDAHSQTAYFKAAMPELGKCLDGKPRVWKMKEIV